MLDLICRLNPFFAVAITCSTAAIADGQQLPPLAPPLPSAMSDEAPVPPEPETLPIPPGPPRAVAITIADLEQLALRNNPTLSQAMRQIAALRGQRVQVGLYPNPVLGYQAEEVGDNGSSGQHGIYFQQQIITADKLGLNRAVVSQEIRQAEWELDMQRRRIINDVRARSYAVVAAQQTVEIMQELVEIGQAAVDVAERLEQARQVSQVDVLQARVEANSAKLKLVAAEKEYVAAWRRLSAVVGTPGLQPTPLQEDLTTNTPNIDWDAAVAMLRHESPQLAKVHAGVERAQWAVSRARAGQTPDIQTQTSVRYNDDSDNATVSLQVGAPLMIFNRNQGNILRANAELAAAQREVKRVELALQDQLAGVYREYDIAREQVEQYRRDILPYAEESLTLTKTGYEQGEFTYLELLTAQRTFSQTNLAYINQLRDLWLSAIHIDGMLLTGGLQSPRN